MRLPPSTAPDRAVGGVKLRLSRPAPRGGAGVDHHPAHLRFIETDNRRSVSITDSHFRTSCDSDSPALSAPQSYLPSYVRLVSQIDSDANRAPD